jgi:hypothetical protein
VAGCGTVFKLTPPAAGETEWTESVLYRFAGKDGDGLEPFAGLIMDASGALYSTTFTGGVDGNGTVFELTPPAAGKTKWSESVLYSFPGVLRARHGAYPSAGLIMDASGALYGTTDYGGTSSVSTSGYGTVFEVVP